ncbi:hypothetical protein KSAC_32270 (plasmid) [Komagataeibacter saccharivorans]|uniref:hypothetical protein n=1 Tax=Komagataeibacter saccharivorans TaxID=265959 RepID=UPI0010533BB2|nr:hypothetical protein [Komagataeibacter saccharivorans]QBL95406.1 hypothetical protein KSAC_32270 [Komagataeibacter saccharivorans]
MQDTIDIAAGLASDSRLFTLRHEQAELVAGTQACQQAVLAPADCHGLDTAVRLALAHRIAVLNDDEALARLYADSLHALAPDSPVLALAEGRSDMAEPFAGMARQADLATMDNAAASERQLAALEAAGLDRPQIVALSELIAFVNYQCRITAGLRLLKE